MNKPIDEEQAASPGIANQRRILRQYARQLLGSSPSDDAEIPDRDDFVARLEALATGDGGDVGKLLLESGLIPERERRLLEARKMQAEMEYRLIRERLADARALHCSRRQEQSRTE